MEPQGFTGVPPVPQRNRGERRQDGFIVERVNKRSELFADAKLRI
jgi:hypothetical protein